MNLNPFHWFKRDPKQVFEKLIVRLEMKEDYIRVVMTGNFIGVIEHPMFSLGEMFIDDNEAVMYIPLNMEDKFYEVLKVRGPHNIDVMWD